MTKNSTVVDEQVWSKAQTGELSCWLAEPKDSDDWNVWWMSKLGYYKCLENHKFGSVLEVGCGPYAKNMQYFLSKLNHKPEKLLLEDPLLDEYVWHEKSVKRFEADNAIFISEPLEKLSLEEKVDCILCINVLDHVMDADKCFQAMYENLKKGGVVVIGQDLTDVPIGEDDLHPIWFDDKYIDEKLNGKYTGIFRNILPREQGRNPAAHYATYLYIGEKI